MDRFAKIKIFVVYCLRNKKNGKRYIGKSSGYGDARTAARKRFAQHIANSSSDLEYALYRALRKYGHANFKLTVLSTHNTDRAALDAEVVAIAKHRTLIYLENSRGYNMTRGGDGVSGGQHSTATKAVMSARKKELFSDPDFRAAHARRLREANQNEEIRARKKAARDKMGRDPKYLAANAAHCAKVAADPVIKKKISASLKIWYADPANAVQRQRNKERIVANLRRPEVIEKNKLAVRALHKDPAYRAKMAAHRATPEYKARQAAATAKREADPAYRAKHRAAVIRRNADPAYQAAYRASVERRKNTQ